MCASVQVASNYCMQSCASGKFPSPASKTILYTEATGLLLSLNQWFTKHTKPSMDRLLPYLVVAVQGPTLSTAGGFLNRMNADYEHCDMSVLCYNLFCTVRMCGTCLNSSNSERCYSPLECGLVTLVTTFLSCTKSCIYRAVEPWEPFVLKLANQ